MDYTIEQERGYYAVYINGNFYCTADTHYEAEREVKNYFQLATEQN